MIYKVKEVFPEEFSYLREGMIIFTYYPFSRQTRGDSSSDDSKVIGIAYEDVILEEKKTLLSPMSELGGKGAFLIACHFMQSIHGGPGIMFNDISGQKSQSCYIWSGCLRNLRS